MASVVASRAIARFSHPPGPDRGIQSAARSLGFTMLRRLRISRAARLGFSLVALIAIGGAFGPHADPDRTLPAAPQLTAGNPFPQATAAHDCLACRIQSSGFLPPVCRDLLASPTVAGALLAPEWSLGGSPLPPSPDGRAPPAIS